MMFKIGDRVRHIREGWEGNVIHVGYVNVYGKNDTNGLIVSFDNGIWRRFTHKTNLLQYLNRKNDWEKEVTSSPHINDWRKEIEGRKAPLPGCGFKLGDEVYHYQARHLGRGSVSFVGPTGDVEVSFLDDLMSPRHYSHPHAHLVKLEGEHVMPAPNNYLKYYNNNTAYFDLHNKDAVKHYGKTGNAWVVIALHDTTDGPKRAYLSESEARRVAEEMTERHEKPFVYARIAGIVEPTKKVVVEEF